MYYKFLTSEHTGEYSGFDYSEYLPRNGKPGKWLPKIEGYLELCERGYHACVPEDVLRWINTEMYEVELRGDITEGDEKVVARQIRLVRKLDGWNDKTARLFAVWCAREALKLVDNPDPRSIAACDVAERYANGEATSDELAAARAAAQAAAQAAARDAARDAAQAAAWDAAAWAAAWDAAQAAAQAAAWDAAAWDAAWDAAAWDAAWAAARDAQIKKFWAMVEGDV